MSCSKAWLEALDKYGVDTCRKVRDTIQEQLPYVDLGFLAKVCDDPAIVKLSESNEGDCDEEDEEVLTT